MIKGGEYGILDIEEGQVHCGLGASILESVALPVDDVLEFTFSAS